jgi:hypothetical protein
MSIKHILLFIALCVWVPTTTAQDSSSTTLSSFVETRWKASCEYTRAFAEQMPGTSYDFRPTREQMTFKEQVLHIADQNDMILSEMSGRRFVAPSPISSKAEVLRRLDSVRDFGFDVLRRKRTTATDVVEIINGIMLALDHTTHHRGQLVVYLRLNNLAPPEYRR